MLKDTLSAIRLPNNFRTLHRAANARNRGAVVPGPRRVRSAPGT